MSFLAAVDLAPVDTAYSALVTACLASAVLLIPLAMSLGALPRAGRFIKKVWSAFAS